MEKELTIVVPNAAGEEGLTHACKRGELFRNDAEIEKYYRQGYVIHHYSIVEDENADSSDEQHPHTMVKVYFNK